ncbi:hypothetical protein [Tenacibaculum finnmarkense]|uniref:hypothetical protein n=1 Tax=Tenacibaculum finnmarkense TaxID=2781243 RepID=UPI00207A9A5A|nr:hypothetical protein [Tenacibaculum finnmarkense]MCM8906822.1 hypothetical protein [Tenacibaculum finnmarkense genomovar finnmarkense]
MKKLLLLLLAFISLNTTAQKDYFPNRAQFGVTPLSNSTDKLGTIDAQGFLNKSTISVQDLIDGLSPDLSDVMFKSVDEDITGEKTFIKDASGGGVRINNTSTGVGSYISNTSTGAGSYIDNYSTGTGSLVFNTSTGRGSYIGNTSTGVGSYISNASTGVGSYTNNISEGTASKIYNTAPSTGDALVVEKQDEGEVFKIDNVGNLEAQQATFKVIDQDNTATKLLVADNTGKVGYQDKVDYLPLTGGTLNNTASSATVLNIDNPIRGGVITYRKAGAKMLQIGSANAILGGTNEGGLVATFGSNPLLFYTSSVKRMEITPIGVVNINGFEAYHKGNQTINNWVVYGNSGATQIASANVPTIINNNAGNLNNNGNITSLYDTGTQRVNLTQARVGDSLNITMEVEVTTSTNSQVVYMTYTGSQGTSNEWTVNLTNEIEYKNQGTRNMVCSFKVPLEFATDISAPGAIRVVSDGTLNFKANYHSLTIN